MAASSAGYTQTNFGTVTSFNGTDRNNHIEKLEFGWLAMRTQLPRLTSALTVALIYVRASPA